MNGTAFAFFVPHVLFRARGDGSPGMDLTGPLLGIYVVVAVLFMPAWLRIADVMEKHVALAAAYMLQGLGFLSTFVFCGWGEADVGAAGLAAFGVGGLASAVGMAGTLVFPASMRSDLCTQDEFRTGLRREGRVEGLFTLAHRVCQTMGVALVLLGLRLGGFREGFGADHSASEAVHPQSAYLAIRVVYAAIPGVLIILATVPLVRSYRLDRAQQAKQAEAVEAVRCGHA